ncbi:MAG: hypothetical protein J7K58_03095 [Euryarchaeota archaeon]|nr:hypothetical protein [Euryarchaeota archaeon]
MVGIAFLDFARSLAIIAPAIALLYWLMGRLETHVKEERLFVSFLWGTLGGILLGYFNLFLTRTMGTYLLNYFLSIPLLEESAKGMYVLKLRGLKSIEIVSRTYSFGIALGTASVFVFESSPYSVSGSVLLYIVLVFLYALSYMMLHATNGALIGLYTYLGKGPRGIGIALVNNVGYKLLFYALLLFFSVYGLENMALGLIVAYTVPGFYLMTKKLVKKEF